MRREIDISGMRYVRTAEPTATMLGHWTSESADEEYEGPPKQVERDTAMVLDRLVQIEDAIILKEEELRNEQSEKRGDMAIDIGPSERILLTSGIPLVIQNGKQNITLTWSAELDEEELEEMTI